LPSRRRKLDTRRHASASDRPSVCQTPHIHQGRALLPILNLDSLDSSLPFSGHLYSTVSSLGHGPSLVNYGWSNPARALIQSTQVGPLQRPMPTPKEALGVYTSEANENSDRMRTLKRNAPWLARVVLLAGCKGMHIKMKERAYYSELSRVT